MKTRELICCLVVTLCLGATWANGQTTVYVSRDGLCSSHGPCYSTIQAAIDAIPQPSTIKITQETYEEDVVLDVDQLMTLEGGWNTGFTSCSSYTLIRGSLTLVDGTTIIGGTGRIVVSSPLPTISNFSANPGAISSGSSSTLSWATTKATSASIDHGVGSVNPVSGSVSVSPTTTTTYTLTATNAAGSVTAQTTVTVIVPPTINVFSVDPATINLGESSTLSWTITNATSASIDQGVGSVDPASGSINVSPTATTTYTLTATNAAGSVTAQITVTVVGGIPPDPKDVAPPIDPTIATTVHTATSFLYTGPNPIQTGVAPGTIDVKRTAVLRGKVMTRDDQPLSGVSITILSHPEFGQTLSRLDGMFDMAVNGGGPLTVKYEKSSYLPVQRQVNVPWQDFVWLSEVILIPVDTQVTTIDLTKTDPFQVARGSVVTDNAGSRQSTLLFSQGTLAELAMPDGSKQPITSLNVRATEFTVGPNGAKSMPAELPPNSAYTYCSEFSSDEELAASAKSVTFSKPVIFYLDNFLNGRIGWDVPLGEYDRAKGIWVPSNSGRIIKILSISGGLVELDIDGTGTPANSGALAALGITDAERERLAALYPAEKELWRMPIPHFSSPWDANWAFGPPPDAVFPNQPPPRGYDPLKCPDKSSGSIIECQNQVLGETLAITGTPYRMHYQSDRIVGHKAANTLEISLSGAAIPNSLTGIELEIEVAGREFKYQVERDHPCLHEKPGLAPAAISGSTSSLEILEQDQTDLTNQRYTFVWDGKDVYGRTLQGRQSITVRIGYTYCGFYQKTTRFGYDGGGLITGSRTRRQVTLWQVWQGSIGPWDGRSQGFGSWSLNVHHTYDSLGRTLYQGDGLERSAQGMGTIIAPVAGVGTAGFSGDGGKAIHASVNLAWCSQMATGPDGSLYIADSGNNRIRKVGSDGIIQTIAGTGGTCDPPTGLCGDGGPATQATFWEPCSVAIGNDGNIYIGDTSTRRVRRIGLDGIVTTVAGSGLECWPPTASCGDGGPANMAKFTTIGPLAVGKDGSLYIGDYNGNRIRKVAPDGIITTIAGNGTAGFQGDGGQAIQAQLNHVPGLTLGKDGSIYIPQYYSVRRVGPDGIIKRIVGTGSSCTPSTAVCGDGGPALQAHLSSAEGIAMGLDSAYYIGDVGGRLRRVGPDGIITTMAGNGLMGSTGDGGPATQARIKPRALAFGQDGSLYLVEPDHHRIRRVGSPLRGCSASEIFVPSEDGTDLYRFDSTGRHLQTINALTGSVRYEFKYDSGGLLVRIQDGDGNITTIERDLNGNPVSIVAPFGQRTNLGLDINGYLASLGNPAGETFQFLYTSDGLLTTLTDPKGHIYRYTYDTQGRLTNGEDSAGGSKTLVRTWSQDDYEVKLTTGMERVTTYSVENLSTGDLKRIDNSPDGTQIQTLTKTNGTSRVTLPDGTLIDLVTGPDPRFSMQAPIAKSTKVATPGGKTLTLDMDRTVVLSDPNNPLSLSQMTETINFNGRTYTSVYSSTNNTFTDTTPVGRQRMTTIDTQGRMVKDEIKGLSPITLTYDAQDRLITLVGGSVGDERQITFTYNPEGYLDSIVDPLANTRRFEYDLAGRLTKEVLPDSREITYVYDANGNMTSITPPGRAAHSFAYTPVNLLSDYTPPDIGPGTEATQYSYNKDRQLTKVLRPDGLSIDLSYDSGGRLSTMMHPSGQISYVYDSTTGNLSQISNSNGVTLSYNYDGSLVTGEAWTGPIPGSVGYSYDNDFRVNTVTVTAGSVNTFTYQYDNDGLIIKAGDMALTRNSQNGLITGTSLGSVTDVRVYNGFGELSTYSASYGGAGFYSVQYTYDKVGRITQRTETVSGTTDTYGYFYDSTGRLTTVKKNGVITATYTYDSNDNRLSVDQSGDMTTYTYDTQDRLTAQSSAIGAQSYSYSVDGELQSKSIGSQTTTYNYDVLGNLIGVTLPDGTLIEYVIDGKNRRIGKKVNGTLAQRFLYQDLLKPAAALDESNNVLIRFVYAADINVPDYMIKDGVTYRIIKDHLGSPRLIINIADGSVAQRVEYNEFGKVTYDTKPGFQPFGFAGGLYDSDTGLVRFGARDYDAQIGRWTAKDPILFAGGQDNLYVYVGEDPVSQSDLFGTGGRACWGWMVKKGRKVWVPPPKSVQRELAKSHSEAAKQSAKPETSPTVEVPPVITETPGSGAKGGTGGPGLQASIVPVLIDLCFRSGLCQAYMKGLREAPTEMPWWKWKVGNIPP